MKAEEIRRLNDNVLENLEMLMFITESGSATEGELKNHYSKSPQTLNRRLSDLVSYELVIKKEDLNKEKRYAHYIYIATTKLYDLIQYINDRTSRISPSNKTISKDFPSSVQIS